ncbi:hypothetical protein G6F57_019599 [Rhizopus arrhizus]|nr:hypothetical protein G6F57_019599 [Rhizopus arrhizus]
MASRYFATVRRATGIPDDLSRSASLASESGLRGFSSSISRRIMAWMAVLDASPPPSVSMPDAKKARSGRVPRGAELGGDLAQGQRAQRLFAELEESGLLQDQAAHHPQQGFAALLQPFQQPARLLQLRAKIAGIGLATAADELFVAAVDHHLRPGMAGQCPAKAAQSAGLDAGPANAAG